MRKLYLKIFSIMYLSKIWKIKNIFSSKKNIPIIMYHDLFDMELFKRQMLHIKKNYNVISLIDYIKSIKYSQSIQNNSIIITFDDGYESTYSIAMQVLDKLELKATVFIAPALLCNYGKGLNSIMSIEKLQKLSQCEFIDIGGHTLNHKDLGKIVYNEAYEEISNGKIALEKLIHKKVTVFAYPFGKKYNYNSDTIDIVRENGFCGAVTTNRFKNSNINEGSIYEINRIGIDGRDTYEIFVAKINRMYPYKIISLFEKLRRRKQSVN